MDLMVDDIQDMDDVIPAILDLVAQDIQDIVEDLTMVGDTTNV